MKKLTGVLVVAVALPLLLVGGIVAFGGQQQANATGYGDELNAAGIPPAVVPWIQKAAKTCPDVTAPLLAAQMKAESNFNPSARSPVGAQGIAQFMPGTWATWGADADGNGRSTPLDVGDAVMAQARFMCSLINQVDNLQGDKLDLALAAYNAGPGAVQRYGGIPPYAETRAYIARIKQTIPTFTAAITIGDVALPLPPGSGYVNQNNWGQGGSRWARSHTGLDLSVACGTPVRAANAGRIIVDTNQSWAGRWLVQVQTAPGRLTTWYAHMQSINVRNGQTVKPGQTIGQVGALGNVTGCHLHFELHPQGGAIYQDNTNPAPWLTKNGVKLR